MCVCYKRDNTHAIPQFKKKTYLRISTPFGFCIIRDLTIDKTIAVFNYEIQLMSLIPLFTSMQLK